jgi:serine/threonine protein kinase
VGVELVAGAVVAGRYRLERQLGHGGMGEVWAATHTVTRRNVAMKFIKAPIHARPELRRRFLREARAASAVRHPNVVEVLDVFELDADTPVMVMDLLKGETLGRKLARFEVRHFGVPPAVRLSRRASATSTRAQHAAARAFWSSARPPPMRT